MDIKKELKNIGLSEEQYQNCLNDICDKINGLNNLEWADIKEKYNLPYHYDVIRKASQTVLGGVAVSEWSKLQSDNTPLDGLDLKLQKIRQERIKLQTLNTERNRIDRSEARQALYYEQVGSQISTLPLPDFKPLYTYEEPYSMQYVLTLADMHYGADFISQNNIYNREIFKSRLLYLTDQIQNFVIDHNVKNLKIVELGDTLQGLLRISDLKINDTSVVKCVVEVSHLLAQFLNELTSFVEIEYYHVPNANHCQIRPIGSKANELGDEDLEYIISHYIKDLLKDNRRVKVFLPEEGENFIYVDVFNYNVIAMHGHTIKNYENAVKDVSSWIGAPIDYLLLGHFHSGQEISCTENGFHDTEVLISPSFVGSDLYSDSLLKGSRPAVKIYGFEEINGHTESHKILLD